MTTPATPVKAPPRIITISEREYQAHCNDLDGICFGCFEWTCGGVEPDARKYKCDGCDAHRVYGAEEALMMGRIEFGEDSEDE